MLFSDISLVDEQFCVRHHMYLGTEQDRITYLSDEPPENPARFGEVYAKKGEVLLLPGFCSAHSHQPMSLLRGYGENESLMNWLTKKIFPFEARLTGDDIYYGTLLGAAEAFRFGVVSTSDMYFSGARMAQADIESGIKSNICLSVSCFDDSHYRDLPVYREFTELYRDYNGAAGGRIRIDGCLHSEYTTTEQVAREACEAVREMGAGLQIHISETADEVAACRARHGGLSPVEYFHSLGAFEVPVTAAHCVHLSEQDMDILREKKVSVASCPKSNAKLASGICPVHSLLEKGVNVAVGTDSVASNNNLNMTEELKFFNLLCKCATGDASLLTPSETLYAGTRAGFLAQGRTDCGLLKVGCKADLAVFSVDAPYLSPCHDELNNLIYSACGTDVVLTLCDGRVVYRDGEYPTLDLEKIRYHVDASIRRILGEL